MSLAALFATAFVMGFSGAMMPGPLLTVTINESYRRGFKAGPLLVLGHGLLELALIAGLTLGLYNILAQPSFQSGVAVVGGLILLWLGWGMAKDAWAGRISLQNESRGFSRGMSPVLAGIVVSLSNPYWILWWATIGLAYVTQALQKGVAGLLVFFAGHILADLTWYSAVSLAAVSGKKVLSEGVYRGVLMVCGVFLLGLGLYFVQAGITRTV
ncbi:MAG: LysE family transporter [Clostridia bacterium]|jgi:threonine/homoserine/homoserine lactone efflux protein|nr:LysE family transporter [Clostridia bacterium]